MRDPAHTRPNILLLCSDQHHARMAGYRGHAEVKTPSLDRLASEGVHFTRSYCNTPICGPSRISFMTGRELHELGLWCNGVPWNGKAMTWADRLGQAGYRTLSRGKMDVPGPRTDVGFSDFDEPIPRPACDPYPLSEPRIYDQPDFHFDSFMDLPHAGMSREARLRMEGRDPMTLTTRFEENLYLTGHYDHDRHVVDQVLSFLRGDHRDTPWALHVGLLNPHWPYVCPEAFLAQYDPAALALPQDSRFPNPDLHPALQHYQGTHNHYQTIRDETHLRQIIAAYYGLITCMDSMVGEIMDCLAEQDLAGETCLIYTSDHGEACGEHGLFDKLTAYEASAAVPLIVRGPGLKRGVRCDEIVSLVDLYPTILDLAGIELSPAEKALPGRSWVPLLQGLKQARTDPILIEYHGIFFRHHWFALVEGDWKFVWYEKERPSLFNLREDPHELHDLGADPARVSLLSEFESKLRSRVDPEAVVRLARRELGWRDGGR
ncbi:MAG: sulfatase-like hydrolase/transferase [Planctomycetes bacterium]|nr:sulfatase-like hydrolase/transferase [Planctomycetota bacterium]